MRSIEAKTIMLLLMMSISCIKLNAQKEEVVFLESGVLKIEGTLLMPDSQKNMPVVLIISGSGPTDRDGNNPMMKNNSLKMLAEGLCENNIASLRFDKRGVGKSANAEISEKDLRFDDYINDVVSWINLLKKDPRFTNVIIIGHSEGSLIGMIAAQKTKTDKYISIAGASQSIDKIIKEQLNSQPSIVLENAMPILDSLAQGYLVKNVPPFLNSLFRESVQPYMISWIKYDPQQEIKRLKIPMLIIQGTTDIQIGVKDAEKLNETNKNSKLIIIEGMNHILKDAELDRSKNLATYSNPDLPLNRLLIDSIVEFIK